MSRVIHLIYILTFSVLLLFSLSLFAKTSQPLSVKEGAPKTYTVVKGDTLWDISALYLDSPWLWPKLWKNNDYIDNPDLIYPGDKLTLYWLNGEPVLTLKPMVKLSPKVRLLDKQAVPTVKESLVIPYLTSDRLVDLETLSSSSKVLGASSGKKFLTAEDSLFISGVNQQENWGIYRVANQYKRDDKTMVALKRIASAKQHQVDSEITKLTLTNQRQEIWPNDIALPDIAVNDTQLTTTFYPSSSPRKSMATILGALNGSEYSVKNQVVIIDRGSEDKVQQGSMFKLYQSGAAVYEHKGEYSYKKQTQSSPLQLPNTEIGSLMVIRPYSYFSLALITSSEAPISNHSLLVSPESEPTGIDRSDRG
ncbi:LysM peptidoglycan-binding domain-containing protein [Vibrio sp. ZSDE26]|uniref:LysM peptidoglycan-binding domain-containing protein n=1 Tax=Vibrio amylolyticus TaxID=2847292 RepID=A0A9X1XQZ3_9VIBR|nr:LysM peptidoglycan-binding domain-containing protein [Vibrio amylolyticus]MCK6265648.1 LysM peptidoglycan-binding domain-containing protein [Vibrio amylolyticus]